MIEATCCQEIHDACTCITQIPTKVEKNGMIIYRNGMLVYVPDIFEVSKETLKSLEATV
jgi:hypothetical protein